MRVTVRCMGSASSRNGPDPTSMIQREQAPNNPRDGSAASWQTALVSALVLRNPRVLPAR